MRDAALALGVRVRSEDGVEAAIRQLGDWGLLGRARTSGGRDEAIQDVATGPTAPGDVAAEA